MIFNINDIILFRIQLYENDRLRVVKFFAFMQIEVAYCRSVFFSAVIVAYEILRDINHGVATKVNFASVINGSKFNLEVTQQFAEWKIAREFLKSWASSQSFQISAFGSFVRRPALHTWPHYAISLLIETFFLPINICKIEN